MTIEVKQAQFLRSSDASFMYAMQSNGDNIQQYKKVFFLIGIEAEKGAGTYILHASYSKEGEWTRFLIEHHMLEDVCCLCSTPWDEIGIYCNKLSQTTLHELFEKAIEHPNVRPVWESEKQTL